ncbi:MAG: energy transducer TonB, partial [Oceanicaulis sp.]
PVEPEPEVRDREPEPVRPAPRPRPRPVPPEPQDETKAEDASPQRARPAPAQVQGREGVTGDDALQQSVDTDGETDTAGYEATAASHDDLVLARFASAKRYPARARMRGREGVVAVEFTLDPDGAVLDARVLAGSGHRALDRAALDQVHRAEPFPARPETLDWRARTYRSEVRFSLRDAER